MAITKAESINGSGGGPPPAVALTTACSVGDVITVEIELAGNPHGSGTPTAADVVVHDTVNAGNYTCAGFRWDATNSIWVSVHWIRCNAAGTPTVSAALTSSAFGTLVSVTRWSGWTGVATADASIGINNGGTGTAISLTPVVTNFANELLLVQTYTAGGVTVAPSGYTSLQGGGLARTYYAIEATSGTSAPFSAATNSGAWDAVLAGIYDNTTGFPTVTSVNGSSAMAEGATGVAIVGTNFAAGMTSNLLQPGGVSVAQATTYNSATSASINLTVEPGSGSQLAYTDSVYTTTYSVTVAGNTSAPVAATIAPLAGIIFKTMASVNGNSGYVLNTTPPLAINDQVRGAGNSSGTTAAPAGLVINSDGTWGYQNGFTVQAWYASVYDAANKVWSPYTLQSKSVSRARMMFGFLIGRSP